MSLNISCGLTRDSGTRHRQAIDEISKPDISQIPRALYLHISKRGSFVSEVTRALPIQDLIPNSQLEFTNLIQKKRDRGRMHLRYGTQLLKLEG